MQAYDLDPRCQGCGKLLAEKVTRPWVIGCVRCKARNSSGDGAVPRRTIIERTEPPKPGL